MYLFLAIIGIGWIAMMFVAIAGGSGPAALVLAAALLVFIGLWKWKQSLPEGAWNKSRFKYGRVIRVSVGTAIFAIAMLELGIVTRTFWANYWGEQSDSVDLGDIYSGIFLTVFALALIGYERIAGVLFAEFFFSTILGGIGLRVLAGPEGQVSALTWVSTFALAFGVVFALGHWFRWSKEFALAGMISVAVAYLGFYLTM